MVTSFQRPLKKLKAPSNTNKNIIEFRQLQHEEKVRLSTGQAVSQSSPRRALPATLHAFNIYESGAVKPNTQASAGHEPVSISVSARPGHSHRNSIALSVVAAIVVGAMVGISWQSGVPSESEPVIDDTRTSQSLISKQASAEEPLQASPNDLPPASPPVAATPPVAAAQPVAATQPVAASPPAPASPSVAAAPPAPASSSVAAASPAPASSSVAAAPPESPPAASLPTAAAPPAAADANQMEDDLNSTEELARQYAQEIAQLHARNASLNSIVDARGKEATDLNNELVQLEQDLAAKKSAAQPTVVTRTVYNFVNGAAGNNPGNIRPGPSQSSEVNWESGADIVDDDYEQIPVEWDSNGQPIVFVDAYSGD